MDVVAEDSVEGFDDEGLDTTGLLMTSLFSRDSSRSFARIIRLAWAVVNPILASLQAGLSWLVVDNAWNGTLIGAFVKTAENSRPRFRAHASRGVRKCPYLGAPNTGTPTLSFA